ncbi:MAG: histidine kinase [Clostridiales bacterium]|nr:histidine kinase [Clostridiales bacterium]
MLWVKKISLQRRILLTFILFFLILSVVFGLFILRTSNTERDYYGRVLMQANRMIDNKLTTIIQDLRFNSSMYLVNTDILTYVENDFYMGKSLYVEALRGLKSNTLSVKINPDISSVTYLTLSDHVYSGAGYNEEYLENLKRMAQTMDENEQKYYVSHVYETTINQQNVKTVTYAFLMNNPYNFKPIGHGFINIDIKRLAQTFQVLTVGEDVMAMGVQNGQALFESGEESQVLNQPLIEAIEENKQEIKAGELLIPVKTDVGSYLSAILYNEAMDLNIVNYVPMDLVNSQATKGIKIYLYSVSLLMIVFVGSSAILSMVMTKPIRILQAGMKELESGDMKEISEQTDRQDDMGELIRGFNHMVYKLRESILREYEQRDLQRKAQIKMLESQINPHFLYNVLNLISSIAQIEDVPEISDIATDLGDLFRYSISGGSTATLSEELDQVRRYIAIQRMCMAGDLKVEYNISEDTLDMQVLKFMLQPLVENCFVHGFGRRGSGGILTITSKLIEDQLYIAVSDDGAGIEPERLHELQELCRHPQVLYQQDQSSIGMLNVNFRLIGLYGMEHGLIIRSDPGQGTTLSMLIPVET